MIRRFNYTNRIRILRKDVSIRLRQENGQLAFDADLSALSDYDLPPESLVFVEAYRQTNWMRFNFGQVGAITPQEDRALSQFDSPEGLLFRVKVTPKADTHSLIAEADRIPLANAELGDGNSTPLLPVKPEKLGDELYRVDFAGAVPLLLINSDAGSYVDIAHSPVFTSLVYPAVMREILTRILLVERHDDASNSGDWQSQWIRFASLHPGVGELPQVDEIEDRIDWIDKTVAAFSKKIGARAKFSEFWNDTV